MGLDDFRIIFDNPWNTYYPEDTITGRVVIKLSSPKKIRGIKCTAKGEANTCFTTSSNTTDSNTTDNKTTDSTTTATAHEEYFNLQKYILGSEDANEMELPIGEHVYPFKFCLPPSVPSSFEHTFGHVRYTVKATLDRPWKFDQNTKAAFSIVKNFDLNDIPQAMEPLHEEMSKTFCCLCCGSAPLRVKVNLPVRGFVPGQEMPIRVDVDNQSGVVIERVKLILRKKITFLATTPTRCTENDTIIVSEVSQGPFEADSTTVYQQKLKVPPLPPSNLSECSIIDLNYNLKIEVVAQGWWRKNLKRDNLIFIGTIPLANYQSNILPPENKIDQQQQDNQNNKLADPTYGGYPSGYPAYTNTTDGSYPSVPPSAPPPPSDSPITTQPFTNIYPKMPPPSYEEACWSAPSLRENDENSHVIGNDQKFAPRYPVYKFSS